MTGAVAGQFPGTLHPKIWSCVPEVLFLSFNLPLSLRFLSTHDPETS